MPNGEIPAELFVVLGFRHRRLRLLEVCFRPELPAFVVRVFLRAVPMPNGEIPAPKKNMVETKQLALLFGLTVRRIQQLTQDGILQTEMVGRQRRYACVPLPPLFSLTRF